MNPDTVNVIKFEGFTISVLVIRGGIHKMLFRLAKKQSDLGLGHFGRQLVSEILGHLPL